MNDTPNEPKSSQGPASDRGPSALVIVTGGGRGIGAAVSRRLAGCGFAVLINFVGDRDAADAVAAQIEARGGWASAFQADVGSEDGVLSLFAAADAIALPLSGLVNNAGISGGVARLEDLRANDLTRLLAVNVAGAMLCAREAVRRMSARHGGQGGAIVNLSSMAAKLGGAGEWVHYAASKGAIDTMTIGLAREVAADGIRVNAVAPGLIETDFHSAAGQSDRLARMGPHVPVGRAGTTDEVAEAVAWLMSPGASYVTGAIIPVSGGR